MENIIRKIKQIYPVSDEALQALQALSLIHISPTRRNNIKAIYGSYIVDSAFYTDMYS